MKTNKKSFVILSALLCIISVIAAMKVSITGCTSDVDKAVDSIASIVNEPVGVGEIGEVGEKGNGKIYIWTDEETGVQYIIYREKLYNAGFGGITPRLNSDGSLYIADTEDTTQQEAENGLEG